MSMIGVFRLVPDEQIQALLADSGAVEAFLESESEPNDSLDVDNAWHGIHFLLTGQADEDAVLPLGFMFAGTPIPETDVGYGPATALFSREVREVAAALGDLQSDVLRARYDPSRMNELGVYPSIWHHDPDDDPLAYLLDYYEPLRRLALRGAAQATGLSRSSREPSRSDMATTAMPRSGSPHGGCATPNTNASGRSRAEV
jgi:hypothetical protein